MGTFLLDGKLESNRFETSGCLFSSHRYVAPAMSLAIRHFLSNLFHYKPHLYAHFFAPPWLPLA